MTIQRILIVALPYHNYTSSIAAELRRAGHVVSLYEIQPRDRVTKALRRISHYAWQRRLTWHHKHILEAERGNRYDLVLFIQAHQMELSMLARFREAFAGARFALYNWDALKSLDYQAHIEHFDQVQTFDPDDARAMGLGYLPLFCLRDFQGLPRREQGRGQVYFVGNLAKLPRYNAFHAFKRYCDERSVPVRSHLAVTPPIFLQLLRRGEIPRDVAFGPIAHRDFIDMIETSVATFDFANHAQAGYTMRLIENLCAGKKIITSNPRVRKERFYSPDRFHVFDGLDFTGIDAFLQVPLAEPEADFPEYHIQTFVRHIVDGTSHPLPPAGV
ncbi:hypothetical protein [Sphingomonas sp. MMS24-J13]|uniref:hypothetical protein n=1 Tax=Sphingomonas sp. MMS24-J13 TaxID=3238686 RepID=UPI00384CFBBC